MRDEVREQSQKAIQTLHELGIQHTVMLTGDNEKTARAIAQTLHMSDVKADLMPVDKLNEIEQLKQQYGTVAMVGDGVNDAPALASASVGIAMGVRVQIPHLKLRTLHSLVTICRSYLLHIV